MPKTQTPFAGLEQHEVLAVLNRLHADMESGAQRLLENVEWFAEVLDDALDALGLKAAADAGLQFYMDDNPENVTYLNELVARVKGACDAG